MDTSIKEKAAPATTGNGVSLEKNAGKHSRKYTLSVHHHQACCFSGTAKATQRNFLNIGLSVAVTASATARR